MAEAVFYDAAGNRIALGPKLGQGGEGAVFEVQGSSDRVVKIYHANALTSVRRHKLQAMTALRDEKLQRIAAWPIASVSPTPSAPAVGFIMQKVDGCAEVHELYTPISRRQSFPDARWKFLIHTSLNLARAVKIIHHLRIVIGDINEKNIRVSPKTFTRFIDCDSYQISDGMRTFTCDVGVETFTPPELQGQSFAGKVRTQNHDAFGLAVMIFQLLFMGRHPFVGVPRDGQDMTIAQSIKAFRFAYGRQASNRQVSAPPGTLSLDATGPSLPRLFERAFAPEGVQARPRPSAAEWVVALQELFDSTRACARNRAHSYHSSLTSCPWCVIEAATGVTVWILPISNVQTSTIPAAPISNLPDFTSIWSRIASTPGPGKLPPIPGLSLKSPKPAPEAVALAAQLRHRGKIAGGAMVAAAFLIWAVPLGFVVLGIAALTLVVTAVIAFSGRFCSLSSRHRPFREAFETLNASWMVIEEQWSREAGPEDFDQTLTHLKALRDKAAATRSNREARVAQLRRDEAVRQRNAFLGRHTIDQASITGIGPSRKTTLRSFGIATALDVDQRRIQSVPGFGPELSNRLMLWRRSIESRHVFDPSRDVPASAIASIDTDIQNQLALIGRELSNGVQSLEEARRRIESRRAALQQRAIETRVAYLQAQANINVF